MRVSRLHHPVTTLGIGIRAGVWVQGCSVGCPGCISADTWDPDAGSEVPVGSIVDWVRGLGPEGLDGVTLSGGEPFDQPEELRALLVELVELRRSTGATFDLLCYSGYDLHDLQARFAPILDLLDAVIPGPFRAHAPTRRIWRGSANQDLVPLSPLGRSRYGDFVDADEERPMMQVGVEHGAIWWVGIPRGRDMEVLRRRLADVGVMMEDVSWRRPR